MWKDVYSHEYMDDDWKKFNETLLLKKEAFYSHLNTDDITDADYTHAKRVCKNFKIKNLGECYHLYVQSHTSLLTDVIENFKNMCLELYDLAQERFLAAPELGW